MTQRAHDHFRCGPSRRAGRAVRAVAIAASLGIAACDTADDEGPRTGEGSPASRAVETGPPRLRTTAPPQPTASQAAAVQAEEELVGQGSVSRQSPAATADSVELGAFTPATPPAEADGQGRLPGAGDSTIYIPGVNLFPGSARIDPGIRNPYSGDAEAIAAGERHFNAFNCSGCHAPLGAGGMGPPLSDDEWIHGSEPAQMYLVIMHGRPEGMPAFGSMLPRRTVWELVAYIETLSEIDNYATHLGFDAEHATSSKLESRRRGMQSTGQQ
jgi:mono/diheme cytochrome c family protein